MHGMLEGCDQDGMLVHGNTHMTCTISGDSLTLSLHCHSHIHMRMLKFIQHLA